MAWTRDHWDRSRHFRRSLARTKIPGQFQLIDDIKEETEQEDLSELISLLKLHNLASHPKKIEVLDDEKSGRVSKSGVSQ